MNKNKFLSFRSDLNEGERLEDQKNDQVKIKLRMLNKLSRFYFFFLVLLFPDNLFCQEERQLPRWRPFIEGGQQPSTRITTYNGNLREKLRERNLAPPGTLFVCKLCATQRKIIILSSVINNFNST